MALVQLSDAIVPDVFTNYMVYDTVVMADVFNAGIVVQDAHMGQLLRGGGKLFQHPVWNDLDNAEANVATDAPADVLVPRKLTSHKHQFIRQFRTQGWSSADLVAELAGSDPMKRISSRVSAYWARQFDTYAVQMLNGLIAKNVATYASDQVLDVTAAAGTTTVGGVTVNNCQLHPGVLLTAKQKLGDKAGQLSILMVHSVVMTELQRQNLIAYIPNSQGVVNIPTYMGYRVMVTDNLPAADQGGGNIWYTSYLCKPGIIGFAEKPPAIPVETKREALQGNGAGVEILVTRRQFALHPYGWNFTDASTAGEFPTNAELATAANWTRTIPEVKSTGFIAIKTKNG